MPRAIAHAKTDILEAARRLMAERGYERLAMREVAAACGLATGTLYNYYRAKDALVYELMLSDWAALLASLDARLAAGRPADPHGFLEAAYVALHDYFGTYKVVWTQMAAAPHEEKSDVVRAYAPEPFVLDLAARIDAALPPSGPGTLERGTLLDVLVHLFSTYSSLPGCGYAFLRPVVERLLR